MKDAVSAFFRDFDEVSLSKSCALFKKIAEESILTPAEYDRYKKSIAIKLNAMGISLDVLNV